MIFQEFIKVDFGTFLLDDGLYNTLQNLRHIKILLPNAEHCQTYCLKNISLQPHENQVESDADKKIWIKIPKAESYAESYAEYENMPDAWNALVRALL